MVTALPGRAAGQVEFEPDAATRHRQRRSRVVAEDVEGVLQP